MGIVKVMLNNKPILDQVFQALADPARRQMLERLTFGPASVSELADPLPMSLPAVVQHLQVLEQCGLVQTRKQGRVRTCTLDRSALSQAEQWIEARRAGWEQRLERLADVLEDGS